MRPMQLPGGLGGPAQAPLPAQQSFAARVHERLQRTLQKSLPALLPGIHQISAKTAFDRYPQIFAGAARAAPDARRILSFGCSTGEECATLKLYFPQAKVVGADVNPVSLCKARWRYGSDSVSFAYASDLALKLRAPFDVIFCLTVLRDTRLDAEASIREAYPFDRFDERVTLLHSLLKPGGLLVFHGNMYRFRDASVAKEYETVPLFHVPVGRNITFAKDGKNDGSQYLDVLFRKTQTEARPATRVGLDGLLGPYTFRRKRQLNSEDPVGHFLATARTAEADRDAEAMRRCSYKLIRCERYERAWELRTRAAAIEQASPIPEWEGDDLAHRTIVVRSCMPKHRIGEELRLARFIDFASNRARRCIVLTEDRLVPLLRRSFPRVDVRARGIDDAAALSEADVTAYFETIAFHCAKNAEEMRRSFVPLRADPSRVNAIRQRYRRGFPGPLIGISWTSSNKSKVLPDLPSWAPLLDWPSARFVSLQYGDVGRDLDVLGQLAGDRMIHDPEIDQLTDLDGFAAQIAAIDAVVSVSNTTIDMAGMLGTTTLHIRNDKASEIWPRAGSSPWYPDMTFLYKQHRPWREAFAEAKTRLEQTFSRIDQA
jgi:SAM-dependent methyltransferase